jgi:hypothetical protein
MMQITIDSFRDGLQPDVRMTIDALRNIIIGSHVGLAESIKWNAPSFSHNGEHKITLGLTKTGAVQVVIHRGAKKKDTVNFNFDDAVGLARWPAKDRGVLTFHNLEDVTVKADALQALFRNWIEATAGETDAPGEIQKERCQEIGK